MLRTLRNYRITSRISLSVRGWIRKGNALLALKDTMRAMQAFQKALDLDPNNTVSDMEVLLLSFPTFLSTSLGMT